MSFLLAVAGKADLNFPYAHASALNTTLHRSQRGKKGSFRNVSNFYRMKPSSLDDRFMSVEDLRAIWLREERSSPQATAEGDEEVPCLDNGSRWQRSGSAI